MPRNLNHKFEGNLRIHAGRRILERVREEGLQPSRIAMVVGTSSGPRWCALAALDDVLARILLRPGEKRRVILSGGSAGAWRMAALACRHPTETLEKFRAAYVSMHFQADETPRQRLETISRAVHAFLDGEDLSYTLHHPRFDLSIVVTRLRHFLASSNAACAATGFGAAMLMTTIMPDVESLFWEGLRFQSILDASPVRFPETGWRYEPLTAQNFLSVLIASGTVPFRVAPVHTIPGQSPGSYCDGGVAEYIWNQKPVLNPEDTALLIYHGGPLFRCWLDKHRGRFFRRTADTGQLVCLSPGPRFIASLPDGRIPDRQDWVRFHDRPAERRKRWNEAIRRSRVLGELLEELMNLSRPGDLIRPLLS